MLLIISEIPISFVWGLHEYTETFVNPDLPFSCIKLIMVVVDNTLLLNEVTIKNIDL